MSSHLDAAGNVRMIDVSAKDETVRAATAEGAIAVSRAVLEAIRGNRLEKGDALAAARIAGIMAAKNAPSLVPLCHPLPLGGCSVELELGDGHIRAVCRVTCRARTGAEMEALCGVGAALLTIYDMAKSLDRGMTIGGIRLLSKSGGASGDFHSDRDGGPP